jgi:uridine phosphorylase
LGEGARDQGPLPPPPNPLPQPLNGGWEGSLKGGRVGAVREPPLHTPALPSASPALINPVREPGEEAVAGRVVLACTRPDFQLLSRLIGAKQPPRHLWDCAVRSGFWGGQEVTVAGPALGAPCAVMVLEKLIALGAKVVIALGWCGSLQSEVRLGSLVLADAALGGDGVSPHYRLETGELAPHPDLRLHLKKILANNCEDVPWHAGAVWTTDAYYRETAESVRHFQNLGVLAVDLELAALFAAGRFRGVPVVGLLAVSDELFTLSWRPGHRSGRLRRAREAAARAAVAALADWEANDA